MALSNTTADAVGTTVANALTAMSAGDKNDPVKIWKLIAETIYAALKTDIVIEIAALAITTTGSASTQSGPTAPVDISPK